MDTISGELVVMLPHINLHKTVLHQDSIVICGDQPEVIEYALEHQVRVLVISAAKFPEELLPQVKGTLVISTPFDAYRAVRSIMHAVPVGRLCRRDKLVSFHLDDYLDDVKEIMLQHRFNAYPVVNEEDKVVGFSPAIS